MTICYNACEAAMLILITAIIELSLNLIFRQQEGPHYPGVSQRLLKILHTPAALMGTWVSDGNYWKYLTQVGTWLTPQFKKNAGTRTNIVSFSRTLQMLANHGHHLFFFYPCADLYLLFSCPPCPPFLLTGSSSSSSCFRTPPPPIQTAPPLPPLPLITTAARKGKRGRRKRRKIRRREKGNESTSPPKPVTLRIQTECSAKNDIHACTWGDGRHLSKDCTALSFRSPPLCQLKP